VNWLSLLHQGVSKSLENYEPSTKTWLQVSLGWLRFMRMTLVCYCGQMLALIKVQRTGWSAKGQHKSLPGTCQLCNDVKPCSWSAVTIQVPMKFSYYVLSLTPLGTMNRFCNNTVFMLAVLGHNFSIRFFHLLWSLVSREYDQMPTYCSAFWHFLESLVVRPNMKRSDERNEGGEGTLCKGKSRFVAIR